MNEQGESSGPLEESEALRSYCSRMITHVHRQQCPDTAEETRRRTRRRKRTEQPADPSRGKEREGAAPERRGELEKEDGRPLNRDGRRRRTGGGERESQTSLVEAESQTVHPVPRQLISLLKMKTFTEEMRRAAGAELHDPWVCVECVEQQASLALDTFIRRKRTQLDSHTLEERLHTHLCNRDSVCLLGELLQHLPKPSDAPHRIWAELQAKERAMLAISSECLN